MIITLECPTWVSWRRIVVCSLKRFRSGVRVSTLKRLVCGPGRGLVWTPIKRIWSDPLAACKALICSRDIAKSHVRAARFSRLVTPRSVGKSRPVRATISCVWRQWKPAARGSPAFRWSTGAHVVAANWRTYPKPLTESVGPLMASYLYVSGDVTYDGVG